MKLTLLDHLNDFRKSLMLKNVVKWTSIFISFKLSVWHLLTVLKLSLPVEFQLKTRARASMSELLRKLSLYKSSDKTLCKWFNIRTASAVRNSLMSPSRSLKSFFPQVPTNKLSISDRCRFSIIISKRVFLGEIVTLKSQFVELLTHIRLTMWLVVVWRLWGFCRRIAGRPLGLFDRPLVASIFSTIETCVHY